MFCPPGPYWIERLQFDLHHAFQINKGGSRSEEL
jgi:hypothetical protein